MTKRLIRRSLPMLLVTAVMGVILALYIRSTGTLPNTAASYNDGVYTATAKGYLSDVTVTVTISGGAVEQVEVDASGETPALGGAAGEQLAATLTQTGTTQGVDIVSGSTFTSTAVLEGMDACLAQAAG